MTRPLGIGLIGAGRIGQMHAEYLAHRVPDAQVVIVADVVMEAAERCALSCGASRATRDYREVLSDPDVQAVLICSATPTHAQIIGDAAAAGKHIFCEKPIALDLENIDRALNAVARAGVALQIGFNRRFDANFQRVRHAIERAEIGQLHLLHITSRDPAPPPLAYIRESGGIFLDMTIHDFDMVRFLIGGEVEEVYAVGDVRVDPAIGDAGDLDTAVVVLKCANGAIATINNSRRAVYGYDQRVEAFGSGGMIATGNEYLNTAQISTGTHVYQDLPRTFFLDRYTESYIAELRAFVHAARTGQPPPVTGEDGRGALVLGLAALQSYAEKRPVRIAPR